MKTAILISLAAFFSDAALMNGHYRNQVGDALVGSARTVNQLIWSELN